MTQKQTDYDRVLGIARSLMDKECDIQMKSKSEVFDFAFRKGYEYGRKVRSEEVNLVLIADGEPYAMTRERAKMRAEFAKAAMQGILAGGLMPDRVDGKDSFQSLADTCYRIADAMM